MANPETLVGLDLGTTKICAVLGRLAESGEIEIIGAGIAPSVGLSKGVVVNINQTVDSINNAISLAEQISDVPINSVYVGIAGSHIQSQDRNGIININNKEVDQSTVDKVLENAEGGLKLPQDRKIVHTLPQEYIIDNQDGITEPIGMSGTRLEARVHIVTADVSAIQNITTCCDKAGLRVRSIVLESLASNYAVLTKEEREIGVALVDIGGGTCDICIITNGTVKYTSVIPFGGNNITRDICGYFGIPLIAAEKLKMDYGCAVKQMVHAEDVIDIPRVGDRQPVKATRQDLAEVCQARIEEILMFVDNELVKSGLKDKLEAGIVLTGGTAMLPYIVELSESIFARPVRIGYPRDIIGMKDFVNNPKFATAVGLLRFAANYDEENFEGEASSGGIIKKFFEWVRSVFG